jgi:hypothetical protein
MCRHSGVPDGTLLVATPQEAERLVDLGIPVEEMTVIGGDEVSGDK